MSLLICQLLLSHAHDYLGTHNLVADVHGRAIGLMSLTDRIDTSLLVRCFDLEPYDELGKRGDGECACVCVCCAVP